MTTWATDYCTFPQVSFRRLFEPLSRPVPTSAEIVTAYTNGQVTLRSNRRLDGYHEAADLSGFQGVRAGDFVVHGLDILRGSVGVSDSDGAISAVCTVCAPRRDMDPRFFAYAMRAQAYSGFPRAMARGIREGGADFRRWDTLGELPLPLPPDPQLSIIADYLDAETARIDALVEDAERLRQLAQDRVWARFLERVTSTTAPRVPLRRVLLSISDGPFGSAFTSGDYSDEGAFIVRLGNIGMAEFHHEPEARIPMTLYASFLRHQVRPGDLLIAGLGDEGRHAGRACVAPDLGPAMVKGKCFCAHVDAGLAEPRYLALYLSSSLGAQELALVSHGSGRVMINLEIAKALPIVLPVRSLQTEIVDHTAADQDRADRVRALLGRQIALLLERRQALITAAVTGQLEIHGVAA